MAINPTLPTPGLAQFQTDTVGGVTELIFGDTPAIVTISAKYTAPQAAAGIPARTPVWVDFETDTIELVDGTTVTKANALLRSGLQAGAGGGVAGSISVMKAGCLNLNAIAWPASLDTEAKRLAAFDLSSCQIYVKKPHYS